MTKVISDPRERKRFIRFTVVGTIGAAVDFFTFNLLSGVFGVPPVWASVFSFITAVTSNFLWNRYWTYPDSRSKNIMQQMIQFTVVNLIGLAIRTPLFALLEGPLSQLFSLISFLPIGIISPDFLGHNLALAIAIIVILFWNFFINRFWTYSDVE